MTKTINILHLEDNLLDRELIHSILSSEGLVFDVEYAKNYSQFVKSIESKKFDIILADYSLPSFNGLHALEIVKKKKYIIPFIFVSGAIGEELAIKCLKTGATDYILKDQLKKLMPSIKRALKENEERRKRESAEDELKKTNKKLRRIIDEIVDAFSSLAEKKDPYTAGHQKNVAKIACDIAQKMNLPDNIIKGIRIAGLLHDIGKFYVPSEILNKPGKLTEYEFNIIKSHPQTGYDLLKGIDFPWPVAKIVQQHHEYLNGSGYPKGLKEKDILTEAKIICVSDVIESMASRRPYRPALGIEAALEEVVKFRGKKFDPEIVDICINMFKGKKYKYS